MKWIRAFLRRQRLLRRYAALHRRFAQSTMLRRKTYITNLLLVEKHREVPGCVVECGVWCGGMIAGMASVLGPDRNYFLLDSFRGLPAAKPIDGVAAREWQLDTAGPMYYDNCRAEPGHAIRAMQVAGALRVTLVEGFFDETLPTFDPGEPIAILRLDADWYDSTWLCLTHLYPRVAPGGLILVDDYHTWAGCTRAVHDYLSRKSLPVPIRQFENDVCYLVKPYRSENVPCLPIGLATTQHPQERCPS